MAKRTEKPINVLSLNEPANKKIKHENRSVVSFSCTYLVCTGNEKDSKKNGK